jgi:hypothetical protein
MAIQFRCRCGRQLRAADGSAGRQVRCPGCQEIQVVPEAAAVQEAPVPEPAAPAPRMVRFDCDCGKRMQARAEFAGQPTRCPACGEVVTIPEADDDRLAEAVSARPRRSDGPVSPFQDREEDEVSGGRARSRRKPAPARVLVWPWVAAAATLLVVGGGVTAWLVWSGGSETPPDRKSGDKQPGGLPADLAMVPGNSLGVISVRVADWWKGPWGQQVQQQAAALGGMEKLQQELGGWSPADVERLTVVFPTRNAQEVIALVTVNKPLDQGKILAQFVPGARPAEEAGQKYHSNGKLALSFEGERTVVVGPPGAFMAFLRRDPQPVSSGPLRDALQFAAEGKHQVVAAVVPPADVLQALKNTPALGKEPRQRDLVLPLLDVQSAMATADFGDGVRLDLRGKFRDAAAAGKAKESIGKLLWMARAALGQYKDQAAKGPGGAQAAALFDKAERVLNSLPVDQEGSDVHITVNLPSDLANPATLGSILMAPAVQKIREAAARTEALNNLRQLAIGMHDINDAKGKLPSASVGGGLSWRVALLPYIGHDDLYKQFHLNEPWDSPHNVKLLEKMPREYRHPLASATDPPNTTRFQIFVGPGTPFDMNRAPNIPRDFPQGTRNVLLIVEAGRAVPWTKPEDVPYRPDQPLPALGVFPRLFLAARGDASVESFPRDMNERELRALIAPR